MSYRIIDLETETRTLFKRKASPWHPENWVVAAAWKDKGKDIKSEYYGTHMLGWRFPEVPDDIVVLVGHNIKFDLLWSWDHQNLKAFFKRGGRVWDTQYAEYLIAGQQEYSQMCSLDDIVEGYGGTLKIDEVKALWAAGVQTSDIPEDLLMRYLAGPEGDISNTEKVFLGQYRKAKELGMLNMIWARMDGLCFTTECEWNGIHVNKALGLKEAQRLEGELAVLEEELFKYLPADKPEELEFKFGNRYHLSPLLFGGEIKYQKRVHIHECGVPQYAQKEREAYFIDGDWRLPPENATFDDEVLARAECYKSGKNAGAPKTKKMKVPDFSRPKMRWEDFYWELPGYTRPLDAWKSSTPGLYSVAEEVITELGKRDIPFLKTLAALTKMRKDLGTYYITTDEDGNQKGMLTLVGDDGIIHHRLNHTNTVTTRLSSSDPNMHNVPRGETSRVKALFRSRFGDDGEMGELDYSQLEVVVQGMLSGDKNLCQDLRDRIDFHCKRVAAKFGIAYSEAVFRCKTESYEDYSTWKKHRTKCKEFSFQRAYGAGAEAISLSTGMPVTEVKELIENEDKMYPGVTAFNDMVAEAVHSSSWPTKLFERTKENVAVQIRKGVYVAPTGTRYVFRQQIAPDFLRKRGTLASFSPTELKNYPVQGTGGEVVQIACGKLWRHFVACDNYGGKALLCNTVHDCVWADWHKAVREQVARDMKRIMEDIPRYMKELYGMDVDVPFPVEVEYGSNLFNKQVLHLEEA